MKENLRSFKILKGLSPWKFNEQMLKDVTWMFGNSFHLSCVNLFFFVAGSGGSGYRKFQKINLDIHGQESNFLYPLKIDDLNSTFPSGMPSFQGLC